jgi:hypothetical protein
MSNLARLVLDRRQKSCAWCGVAVLVALFTLGLMVAHLWRHP